MYLAVVLHLPHVSARKGDNLVVYLVVIPVNGQRYEIGKAERSTAPSQAHGVFRCLFGLQTGVSYPQVVEVAERRHAEGVLVQGTHEELFSFPRLPREREGRREATAVFGRIACLDLLGDVGGHHRTRCFQLSALVAGVQGRERGVTYRLGRVRSVGVQTVDESVLREREAPCTCRLVQSRCREVVLRLAVGIRLLATGVFHPCILVFVPRIVVFTLSLQGPLGRERLLVFGLCKEILVPQPLVRFRIVKNHRPRKSPFGVVVIRLGTQFALVLEGMEQVHLALIRFHIRVDTLLFGNERAVLQREGVFALGMQVVSLYRQLGSFAQGLPMADGRSEVPEGASPHLHLRVVPFAVLEVRFLRFDVQHPCRSKESCRLQQVVVVPDGQREGRNIVQREASDVYLSRLCVADGHSVVAHGRMCRPEVPHRNRLQSADAPVVAYIGSGKAFHRIAHVLQAEVLQVFLAEHLYGGGRCNLGRHASGRNGYAIQQISFAVDAVLVFLSHDGGRKQTEHP